MVLMWKALELPWFVRREQCGGEEIGVEGEV